MHIEEEREAWCKFVDLQATLEGCIHVGETIGDGEGKFLHSGGPGLANMVAANADGIPTWHVARTKFNSICHQAHRWLWREEKLLLRTVFLEDVILQRASQFLLGKPALLRIDNVHRPDHGRRAIDGHRGSNLIERQAIE